MNYFDFYEIEEKFFIDEEALKQKFYALSKKYHPDFHASKSEEEQDKLLELSSINNQAYKALQNFNSRLEHILFNKGVLITDEKYALAPDFLMEMMEINESIMDLSMEPDAAKVQSLKSEVEAMNADINDSLYVAAKSYDENAESREASLLKIKDLYYRRKYLLRILESLNKL
jgi:molecular chaperone HscB